MASHLYPSLHPSPMFVCINVGVGAGDGEREEGKFDSVDGTKILVHARQTHYNLAIAELENYIRKVKENLHTNCVLAIYI